MRKKMLSLALALVMCLFLIPSAYAFEWAIEDSTAGQSASDKFTDVPASAWYLGELSYAVANGYISGTSATTFSPDATITRGQFVTILGRMVGASTSGGSTKFTDVNASSWYAPYVAWAVEKGYVNGTSSTTFSPDANITVEQMSVILANYISKSGVAMNAEVSSWSGLTASVLEFFGWGDTPAYSAYRDVSLSSSWAVSSMEMMHKYDLLATDIVGRVRPHKAVTRAEATVSLVRLAWKAGIGAPVAPAYTMVSLVEEPRPCDDATYSAAAKVHDGLWTSGKITSSMNQKAKARVYYDWLIQHCSYKDSPTGFYDKAFSAYGALVDGLAVCEGYSGAYQLLLTLEDIECDLVATFSGDHMWNTAVLDGVTYHIDATWGDNKGYEDTYFCMTEAAAWARFGGKPEPGQGDYTTTTEWSGDDIDWSGFGTGDFDWGQVTNNLFGD